MTRTAVITIAHGRHGHWRQQEAGLARSPVRPDVRIVVAMDDPALEGLAARVGAVTVPVAATDVGLPLAHARNAGAEEALRRGADVLVFLDVDCVPAPRLVDAYTRAAVAPRTAGGILCGPVTYLPPPPAAGYHVTDLPRLDAPHPARPAPRPGDVLVGGAHDLFWSLSFAVAADVWGRIGGFHEGYVGYGAEDTDFGRLARDRGIDLAWIGDARAYHQWHPTQDPPVQHLADILRNGRLFRDRWGEWPMRGWLDGFLRQGLIVPTSDARDYRAA